MKELCQWTWTGDGYQVVGPNGSSIFLPANGKENTSGSRDFDGSRGYYLTSTAYDVKSSYTFDFTAIDYYIKITGNDDYMANMRFISSESK